MNLKKTIHEGLQQLAFWKTLIRREGAKFATPSEIEQYLSRGNDGLLMDGRDLRLSQSVSFQNVAIYGITGKGKSSVIAKPAILDQARKDCVLIVNDMSWDLYRDTSGAMSKAGYKILVLNPNDREHSNRLNPFLHLNTPAATMRFAELFSKAGGETKDSFWSSGAERYIRFFLKCLDRRPDEQNNPHNLYHVLSNFWGDWQALDHWVAESVWDDIFLQNEWKALTTGAEETITSFVTNALVALKIFSEPHVCALTSRSDIDLSTLRKQKTCVYIITPPEDQDIYRPLVSMYFLSFIHASMEALPQSDDLPVFFIYDEFWNSFLPWFDALITTTRKYQIGFLLMMQGQQQLITKYWSDLMHVILAGIATQATFSAADDQTSSYFERRAGKVRVFYRNEERETHVEHQNEYNLMNASEIREMSADKLLIISDNRATTILSVFPSYVTGKWKKLMKLTPYEIVADDHDEVIFAALKDKQQDVVIIVR
jgi:type IV secretion system protein VirD4